MNDRFWMLTILLGLLVAMWLHTKNLNMEIENLTTKLDAANVHLEQEIERGKRVEEIATRIEQGEVERQKQLKRFERNLRELAANDAEVRAVLGSVVPPNALRGLRSYKNGGDNASVDGVPGSR